MAPVGFLEEAAGVKSSTRLFGLILALCVAGLVGVTGVYVLRKTPDAAVIGALAGMIAALVANGIVAIVGRTKVDGGEKGECTHDGN